MKDSGSATSAPREMMNRRLIHGSQGLTEVTLFSGQDHQKPLVQLITIMPMAANTLEDSRYYDEGSHSINAAWWTSQQ
ncbi:hypothetical protein PAAG_11720 [Paracoccidioides lutzii Pb01]|uniref:Uncharacterized protein n=1 Tax=Paracoccidioides lutzii (strain ATCC MYA-826 / Pb01) TaxID=502779 RepID=A0A0A2V5H5_PARBA|nr:hypothetical protein PAAG_11720 [Paracoccidioides lutzii Pb01]KGQ01592.1 hypothetical protein PAAG_11720 [Paracoccidioides lutzii Pb01]